MNKELLDVLTCPLCKSDVKLIKNRLICVNKKCGKSYEIKNGIPIMLA